MSPRQWYRFNDAQAADPSVADIFIIDFIGDWLDDYFGLGVTAKAFVDQLSKLPAAVATIRVHINSPGGDVFCAVNIANALRDQQVSKGRVVETVVDGLAASAASIIAMAGSVVRMADNAMMMIHNPWTITVGSAKELRKAAEDLDALRTGQIVSTYKWHSALSDAAIIALMDAETWMDADEAIAHGFATEKIVGLKAAASLDPRALAKLTIPEKYRDRVTALLAPTPVPVAAAASADILRLCTEAGLDLAFATALVASGATLADAQARVTTEQDSRARAQTRATEIRALCATAQLPEFAADYIAGGLSLTAIRANLTTLTARRDRVEIDGGLEPDHALGRQAVVRQLNPSAIYAVRNARTTK